MSGILYTVENLVDEVRSLLDEENRDSISTDVDILPALNRAQGFAFDIYARKYPEPILTNTILTLTGHVSEYALPEASFEDRVVKVEIQIPSGSNGNNTFVPVTRISFRDISNYESAALTSTPQYYCIVGAMLRFVGTPTGTYPARVWYLRNPERLVLPQGRVTIVNTTSNYVVVDSVGATLTTESDQLGSYVNVVDGQTGLLKGTLQISTLADNRVTFRAVPMRSTVLNRTIGGSVSGSLVAQDDYLCAVSGTCVPYFSSPTTNFLIQYAVAELTRKLGGEASMEEAVLDKFEKQVARTYVNREQQYRVRKRSSPWGIPVRKWWWY